MATITTRAGKGSPLTNAELDSNFININDELAGRLTGNQTITISGDASGSGTTAISLLLANSGVAAGTYTKVTVDVKGRVTSGTSLSSSDVTTALGYTPYNATNPAGYTTNVGTVTSVSGTGTVSGLTLTGSVTSSGSLTLGGTLSLTSGQVTTALGYTPPQPSGTGASGTWAINITGGAERLSALGNYVLNAATNGRDFADGIQAGFVDSGTNGYPQYGSIVRIKTYPNDGGTAELYFPYGPSYGGSAMRYRLGQYNNAGWTSWKTVLDDSNYSSYALPLSGGTVSGDVRVTNKLSVGGSTTDLRFGVAGDSHLTGYVYLDLGGALGNYNTWSGRLSSSGGVTRINTSSFVVDRTGYGSGNILEATSSGYVLGGGKFLADAWVQSNRDFPTGTLITTDINYAVTYGDPFVLEIEGYSYGEKVPFDIKYNGYIYYDTIINHGGISNGLNITGLVALNVGGNLCFWFPSQGYWHGYYVRVYVPYATYPRNRVISITGGAKPSGTKEVALSSEIRQSLHSGNYTSYSPSLTGSGATGTWSINVTGTAGSAGSATAANVLVASDTRTISPSSHSAARITTGFTSWTNNGNASSYADYLHFRSYSDGSGGSENLVMFHKSGIGMRIWQQSFGSGSAYSNYVDVLHSSNYSSYALPLSGGTVSGDITFSNVRKGTVGVYDPAQTQAVWAMGPSYVLTNGGASNNYGNFYGLGWSYNPDYGGSGNNPQSKNGLGHQLLLMWAGVTKTAIGTGIWTDGNITATGNVTAYSDERLKKDWSLIESGFVDRLAVLRCGTYTRIDSGQRQAGVSAQNMREILPEVVSEDNDGTLALAYGNAALVSAVELARELVALKHKVAELEARVH